MTLKIDKALCLCLDKRYEEWHDLWQQCEGRGIEFDPFVVGDGLIFSVEKYGRIDDRYPPVENFSYGNDITKIRHCNALLSHQSMIRRALDEGVERVLLLEDDAYFTDRYDDVLDKLSDQIEELDYDMLYLGWWVGDENDEWNEEIERAYNEDGAVGIEHVRDAPGHNVGGLHGVLVHERILKIIATLPPSDPVDCQLNRLLHKNAQTYFVKPKIIHDKGIFSNCEQNIIERKKL
ncbi:hypothetical protein CL634_08875 [bacterium]|nr:hypothetical protein [bacterium]|tara:strand:+ start:2076 stop:2780 length:705 start_codon:yes stop_codon:yes gene_type:complete